MRQVELLLTGHPGMATRHGGAAWARVVDSGAPTQVGFDLSRRQEIE